MRLRQIALVSADLAAAMADIEAVLAPGEPYADLGVAKFGLVNQVWAIGDTFLEVVSPDQPGTTAERLIEKRGGDGGYMAIFQVDDIEEARARAVREGVRTVSQHDGKAARYSHLHPRDIGGAIVSVDWMSPKEHWEWGGPDWRANGRTDVAVSIRGCEMQGEDPLAMAEKWSAVLGRPLHASDDGVIAMRLDDGGEVRFVAAADGRGDGLGCFDVAVRDPAAVRARAQARGCVDATGEVVLCGTRVRLVQG